MTPTSITENVELIVKNTVDDMVNRVEENVSNDILLPVIKKWKRQRGANCTEKHTA